MTVPFPAPGARARCLLAAVAALLFLARCDCGTSVPPDDTFDGNVVVGDATQAPDLGFAEEAGTPDGDASGPLDSGMSDTGELDAEAPDAGDECTEPVARVLTASVALQDAQSLDGLIVRITGTATRTALVCTALECPAQMPCCNTCTASVSIDGLVRLLPSECATEAPGCSGDECDYLCRPTLDLPQSFRGKLVAGSGQGVGLMLHSVAP